MYSAISSEIYDLDILQLTMESLGFWGAVRNAPAIDYFGRSTGPYPLVIPKQQKYHTLHADMYYDGALYACSMDLMYLESLRIPQRYSEMVVQRALKQQTEHGLFLENIIVDQGTIYYQTTFQQLPINVEIRKDGQITLAIFLSEFAKELEQSINNKVELKAF